MINDSVIQYIVISLPFQHKNNFPLLLLLHNSWFSVHTFSQRVSLSLKFSPKPLAAVYLTVLSKLRNRPNSVTRAINYFLELFFPKDFVWSVMTIFIILFKCFKEKHTKSAKEKKFSSGLGNKHVRDPPLWQSLIKVGSRSF